MSNFHKQNHGLTTTDLLGLVVLVGVAGTIFGAILAQALQDDRPQRARFMAEALGRQLHSQHLKASQPRKPSQRDPASVLPAATLPLSAGRIGKDPWGQPFHYLVQKSPDQVLRGRIYVWSGGPDRKTDTTAAGIETSSSSRFMPSGDDIGYVEEMGISP